MSEDVELVEVIDALGRFFDARQRKLARIVAAELRGEDPRLVDQAMSPLGRNQHIAAVKRRIAEAEARGLPPQMLGASIVGRRHRLSQEALAEEIGRQTKKGLAKAKARKVAKEAETVDDTDETFKRALERARAARRG